MGDVYKSCVKKVTEKSEKLGTVAEVGKRYARFVNCLPKTLGYGIGMSAKEELLTIKEDNQKVIEANMLFNVRLTLTNFSLQKKEAKNRETNAKNCLMIADTILVTDSGCEVLTQGVSRQFNDISYNLDDPDQVDESTAQHSQHQAKDRSQKPKEKQKGVILDSRTREVQRKKDAQDLTKEEERRKNQELLFEQKHEDLKRRYESDALKLGEDLSAKQFILRSVRAYKE